MRNEIDQRIRSANPRLRQVTADVLAGLLFASLLTAVLIANSFSARAQNGRGSSQKQPQLLPTHPPGGATLEPVDWIFVIDTSASMSGVGKGAQNIFPRVQDTLLEFVPKVRDGDSLTIIVF
ncbi:MAG: hypothetical protein ACREDR_38805, partial [Blastocatellia bacterium]